MARTPLFSTPPPAKQGAPDQWTQSRFAGLAGKDKLPFRQLDWPNPILTKASASAPDQWTQTYNYNLYPGKDKLPFRQLDWPNPILRALPAPDQWIQSYNYNLYPGKDALPFRWREFPNPILAKAPAPDQWIVSYNYNLYPGKDQLPARWIEFPNPILRIPPAPDQWVQSYNYNLYAGKDKLPFRQLDWPVPNGPQQAPANWSWVLPSQPGNLLAPFTQDDWPLPGRIASQDQSYTQSIKLTLLQVQAPFNQYDWPVTPGPQRAPPEWTCQYSINLLPGQDKLPFRQQDWPLSSQAALQNQSYTQSYQIILHQITYPLTTFSQYDWPTPRSVSPNVSYIQGSNPYNIQPPFTPLDWPVTSGAKQAPQQWIWQYNANLLAGQDKLAFRQQDWPLPQASPSQNQSYVQVSNPYNIQPPFRPQDWPLQQVSAPANQSFTQGVRLVLLPTHVPFSQIDWPLPGLATFQNQSWTVSYNVNLLPGQDMLPNRQDDWAVPIGPPWPCRAVMDRMVYLITEGLDVFFGAPGQVPQHDYPLGPQPPRSDTSYIQPPFAGLLQGIIWGFEFPEFSRVKTRLSPRIQFDEWLPFTAVITPTNWPELDEPGKLRRRPMWHANPQPDDTSGFPFTTTFVTYRESGDESQHRLPRIVIRHVQPEEVPNLPPFPFGGLDPQPTEWRPFRWLPRPAHIDFQYLSSIPVPVAILLSPAGFSLPLTSAVGTIIERVTVLMSDNSTFTGTLSVTPATTIGLLGKNIVLTRNLTPADIGPVNWFVSATENGVTITAMLVGQVVIPGVVSPARPPLFTPPKPVLLWRGMELIEPEIGWVNTTPKPKQGSSGGTNQVPPTRFFVRFKTKK